jgi:hypothetical protein
MRIIKSLCCAAAITLFAASFAHADEWNKKTYLTFSGPVQIPGTTLQAGTYLFQLADPDNARHVVEVASKDGTHIYGMFLTIPNQRLETPSENVVMFREAPAGAPQAVQAWWYPGERVGEEFVYPRNQAVAIAKANHKTVLATETEARTNTSEPARMTTLRGSKVGHVDENGRMNGEPSKAETTTASAATTTAPANTVNGRNTTAKRSVATSGQTNTATNTAPTNRKSLPRTASSLELFELLSGLSLAAGFSIRRVRRSMVR